MIDTNNFTPYASFIGGIIIGFAIVLFFLTIGRLAGVSGIIGSVIKKKEDQFSNMLFLIGLVLGPLIYSLFSKNFFIFTMTSSLPIIIISGILVGIGTDIGRGCTSGHGICGISRFSLRSILATINFMIFAIVTVFIFSLVRGI